MKISELPVKQELKPDQYVVVDGTTSGTRRIRLDWLQTAIAKLSDNNPGWTGRSTLASVTNETRAKAQFSLCANNFYYRGRNLGTSITTAQWNEIQTGSFNDLCIGDYWDLTVSGTTYRWRIAAFDYERNHFYMDSTTVVNNHYIGVVCDTGWAAGTSSQTASDYGLDTQKQTVLHNQLDTLMTNTFGSSHLFPKPEVFISATGYPPTVTQTTSTMRLPTAAMLGIGDTSLPHYNISGVYSNARCGCGTGNVILPLYRLAPELKFIYNAERIWLEENWGSRYFFLSNVGDTIHHDTSTATSLSNLTLRPIVWIY